MMRVKVVVVAFSMTALSCSAESSGVVDEGAVGVSRQRIILDYGDGLANYVVKAISRTNFEDNTGLGAHVYTWYGSSSDGICHMCIGVEGDLCYIERDTTYLPATNESCDSIVGMGIATNTSHVYTWYADGYYSEGNSKKLNYYHNRMPFTNQTTFSMSQLIDVDNSDNLLWYYYWRDANNRIWRTVGTSDHSSNGSGNGANLNGVELPLFNVLNYSSFWGISFYGNVGYGKNPPLEIESWYGTGQSGTRNLSTDSTNLNQ
jgi:hypothetical protein